MSRVRRSALLALLLLPASAGADPRPVRDADLALGRAIFLRDCAQCHGDAGDGHGREAIALHPAPRNFTRGLFKIRTTPTGNAPRTADVLHTIGHGLPGSGMPAFAALSDGERRAVAAFVLRAAGLLEDDEPTPVPPPPPRPASTPERRAIGRQLFLDAGCPECHGAGGQPDAAARHDLVNVDGSPAKARDLTGEGLRGGDTPIDVYFRLMTGLDGSPMPSWAAALEGQDVWALVDYVLSLRGRAPFPDDGFDPNDPQHTSRDCRGCHPPR